MKRRQSKPLVVKGRRSSIHRPISRLVDSSKLPSILHPTDQKKNELFNYLTGWNLTHLVEPIQAAGLTLQLLKSMDTSEWNRLYSSSNTTGILFGDLLKLQRAFVPVYSQEYTGSNETQVDKYTIETSLANGRFGKTYVVTNDNRQYVLKRIKCEHDIDKLQNARKEAIALAHCPKSIYIIRLHDFFEWDGDYCIVMHYCSQGTLFSRIQVDTISSSTLDTLIDSCLNGLVLLHTQKPPIIHRDIKPDNIFYDRNNISVIGDFGLSRLLYTRSNYFTRVGYLVYKAPEVLTTDCYNIKSDIWSLGCTLLVTCIGDPLYLEKLYKNKHIHIGNISQADLATHIHRIPTRLAHATTLISTCLTIDPRHRPTATELLTMWQRPHNEN